MEYKLLLMDNAKVKVYQHKLGYIAENAKRIDYDWFDKDGETVFVNDAQTKEDGSPIQGFYAMNREGKFCFMFDSSEPPAWDTFNRQQPEQRIYSDYQPLDVSWLFENVSVNALLWKVNKLFDELRSTST